MRLLRLTLILLAGAVFPARVSGQELRIYTKVTDQTPAARGKDGKPPIVSRSLTLFHAGRVYDYIDSAGEVIIYEPAQNRFTILNLNKNLATIVSGAEIQRLLKIAYKAAAEKKSPIQLVAGGPAANNEMIAFQLDPKFEKAFDSKSDRLMLTSPFIRYEAKLAKLKTDDLVTKYRQYADAVTRLNYVMHPRVLLPGPRLALNEQIAARQALPTEVELQINMRPRIHLKAEHSMKQSLDSSDRTKIQQWNSRLQDGKTRRVTVREYQRRLGVK